VLVLADRSHFSSPAPLCLPTRVQGEGCARISSKWHL